VEIWKTLSDFPIGIRDDILRLSANRTRLQNECQNSENSATEASVKLQTIERAIDSQRMMVKEYEDAKAVSLDEFSNIQNLKKKLDIAEHNVKTCQSRLNIALEVLNNYKEKIDVNSALIDQGLTIANIVEFEQKLITARKRMNKASVNLEKASTEWNQVGMSEDKYLELEIVAQEINSGIRPTPKPRKGCRSIISGIFGSNEQQGDQAPTETVIYTQLKPIYMYYRQT